MSNDAYSHKVLQEIDKNLKTVESLIGGVGSIVSSVLEQLALDGDLDSASRQLRMLVKDRINTPMSGKCACRNKCSHCCYQAVSTSSWEAARIHAYLKKVDVVAEFVPDASYDTHNLDMDAVRDAYIGKVCPFLSESTHRCLIYAVRPLECSLLYNISDTPSLCETVSGTVPAINFQEILMLSAAIELDNGGSFADIRQFFPSVTQNKE